MKHLYYNIFSLSCQAFVPTISQNTPSWSYNRPYHSLVQKTCSPICPNCSPLFDTRHSETARLPFSPCDYTFACHTPHTNHPSRTQLSSHSCSLLHLPFSHTQSTTPINHQSTKSLTQKPPFLFFRQLFGTNLVYGKSWFNPLIRVKMLLWKDERGEAWKVFHKQKF